MPRFLGRPIAGPPAGGGITVPRGGFTPGPSVGARPGIGTVSRFPRPIRAPQPVMQGGEGGIGDGRGMQPSRLLGSFHKGGKVKKTGAYRLLKGEKVVPVSSLLRAKK